ncbi:MAG: MFS transporter [Pseudomonadota bacterium]
MPLTLGFAVGSVSTGIFVTTPGLILLFYLTEVVGAPPAMSGLAILFAKVWTILIDPGIGIASDRLRRRSGQRSPLLWMGTLTYPFFFVLMFSPFVATAFDEPLWPIAILFFLATSTASTFSVPYVTVPAEVSDDPRIRARLVGWRSAFVMIGLIVGGVAAPIISGRLGYGVMGASMGAVMFAGALAATLATRRLERPPTVQLTPGAGNIWRFPVLPEFRALVTANVYMVVSVAIVFAALPYFLAQLPDFGTDAVGYVMAVIIGLALVTIPVWSWLGERVGFGIAFAMAAFTFSAGCAALAVSDPTHGTGRSGLVLMGIAFGALQVCPYVLFAEACNRYATNRDEAVQAAFTGLWTAIEKVALACGPLFVGIGLSVMAGSETRPESAIRWILGVSPVALAAMAIIPMSNTHRLYPAPSAPKVKA